MVRKEFDSLNIRLQYRYKNQGFNMKENSGIDSETYQGYAKLLCDHNGNTKDIDSFDDALKFLTNNEYRNKFNWFFNIKFDFESIIKYLEYDQMVELYNFHKIPYKFYELTYLDRKFFAIREIKNKRYFYFYDMFNFLDTSLDNAGEKYLGIRKIKSINAEKLNTSKKYWQDNYDEIKRYCIQDAKITKELADYFWNIVHNKMNFAPKSPFSKGRIAEEYFLKTCYIPTINDIPSGVLKYAYQSYSGGRFEILKRGYQEKVYLYDIKSAYPDKMRNLIDFSKGKWEPSIDINNAYYGLFKCKINFYSQYFSPFMKKVKGLNIYPNGYFEQILNLDEIKFFQKNFPENKIEVIKGYEFIPSKIIYPFKEKIEELYQWKETEKDEDIKYTVKIFMNSIYGKTIQAVGGNTGKLFNPIYAQKITANTRLQLYELALQSPESIISFSTDSVISNKKLKTPKSPKLGEFNAEFEGEGVFIMSDIYTLWNTKKQKIKFRGFKIYNDTLVNYLDILQIKNPEDFTLLDILKNLKEDTKYELKNKRPIHLGEALLHYHKRSIKDINIFKIQKKSININGDIKRVWDREFKNGIDSLSNSIDSMPILY